MSLHYIPCFQSAELFWKKPVHVKLGTKKINHQIYLPCIDCWCHYVVFISRRRFREQKRHMRARGQHNIAVLHFHWNICTQDGWREGKESVSLFLLFAHPFICLPILRTSWWGCKSLYFAPRPWKSDAHLSMWSPARITLSLWARWIEVVKNLHNI